MNSPETCTKNLISVSNYKKGYILGTISVRKQKSQYNSVKYQPLLKTPQSADYPTISFALAGSSQFVVSLVTDRNGEMYLVRHNYDRTISFDDLYAINTFLYTYNIYSLSMATFNKLLFNATYHVNQCSFEEGFFDPTEHKAEYDEYIDFVNRQCATIRSQVSDNVGSLSSNYKIELASVCVKEYLASHPFVYGQGYSEYTDSYTPDQIIASVFYGDLDLHEIITKAEDDENKPNNYRRH